MQQSMQLAQGLETSSLEHHRQFLLDTVGMLLCTANQTVSTQMSTCYTNGSAKQFAFLQMIQSVCESSV